MITEIYEQPNLTETLFVFWDVFMLVVCIENPCPIWIRSIVRLLSGKGTIQNLRGTGAVKSARSNVLYQVIGDLTLESLYLGVPIFAEVKQ